MGLYMMSRPKKPPGPILFKKLQWRKRFARSKAGLLESIRLDFVFSMAGGGGEVSPPVLTRYGIP